MSLPKSLRAYEDAKVILDEALEHGGVRVNCKNLGQAVNLRARIHRFRVLDRDFYAQAFPPDDPRHGISAYDNLLVRLDSNSGKSILIIEPRQIGGYTIEPLKSTPGDGNIS
jgi:hypothetical protein